MVRRLSLAFLIVLITLFVAVTVFSSSRSTEPDLWYSYHCRSTPNVTCVSWDQAVKILRSGRVVEVMQTHSLVVSFRLMDSSSILTIEPSIDMIAHEIFLCGDPCKNIRYGTE